MLSRRNVVMMTFKGLSPKKANQTHEHDEMKLSLSLDNLLVNNVILIINVEK
jgi:hypothetical protein